MKLNSKVWKIGVAAVIIIILIVHFSSNIVVANIVQNQVEKVNNTGRLFLKIDKVKLDLIGSKLRLKGITLKPSDTFFNNFKLGETHKSTVGKLQLDELKIQGFHIFKLLFSNEIITNKISVDGLDFELYKSDVFLKNSSTVKKKFVFDSIFISGVNKVDLGEFEIDKFRFKLINAQTNDTLFRYKEDEFNVSGLSLKPLKGLSNYFKFNKDDLKITFKEQKIELNSGYNIHLGSVFYGFKEKKISISDIQFKPRESKEQLAASYKYNNDIISAETKSLDFFGIHVDTIVRTGAIELDSILVNQLNISIYKDQTKPFNLNKRPLFINEKLKSIKQPLNVGNISIKNGTFLYQEKHTKTKDLMTISIAELNAEINNISSLKDEASLNNELKINLKGKLNKIAPLNLDILMPYNSYSNGFSFSGQVGSANFKDFNSAIYPALGAKIEKGQLQSVKFNAHGNPNGTKGTMTMLYSGVKADFFKSQNGKKGEKNVAVSWLTNTVIATQNPTAKGKVKVALIKFERVPYKGFGNLIWKSFMSGMVNTMVPFGKQMKESKYLKEKRKEELKAEKKEKRNARNKE